MLVMLLPLAAYLVQRTRRWWWLLVGLVMIFFGVLSLYNGYKLPIAEALAIIHDRGAGIPASRTLSGMLAAESSTLPVQR